MYTGLKLLNVYFLQGLIKSTIKSLEAHKNIQTQVQAFCEANKIPLTPTQDYQEWLRATKSTSVDKLTQNIWDRFQDDTILAAFSRLLARGSYEEAVSCNGVEIADALGMLCCMLGKSHTHDVVGESGKVLHTLSLNEKSSKNWQIQFLLHVAKSMMEEMFPRCSTPERTCFVCSNALPLSTFKISYRSRWSGTVFSYLHCKHQTRLFISG